MEFHACKEILTEIFTKLKKNIQCLSNQIGTINKQNPILMDSSIFRDEEDIKEIAENLEINLEMISRNKMKCVFFGKTSNGKSATINALLGSDILPSNIGRTTSCFITIEGCNESCGYLLLENKEKRRIEDIGELADEVDQCQKDINSEIKLFWPKIKCPFLQSEIQLLDSPGVDYSPKNNTWIDSHCRDADVFVYVVDGGSTINESERVFFRKAKRLLKTPNIIILMNKWDQCISNKSQSDIEKLKGQHRETARQFLCEDLKLTFDDIGQRLFFVSATEALQTDRSQESTAEMNEFSNFVQKLEEQLSKRAIGTKFKHHISKAIEYIDKAVTVMDAVLPCATDRSFQMLKSDLKSQITSIIKKTFQQIREIATSKIKSQMPLLCPLITKGEEADKFDKMVSECAEKFIVKVLQDTFKEHIWELSPKIRDQFLNYCRYNISPEAVEQYTPMVLDEYVRAFEKELPRQVFWATNKYKICSGAQAEPKKNPFSSIRLWVPIVTNYIKSKYPKHAEIATVLNEGIEASCKDDKTMSESKAEAKPIPEYYLETIVTQPIMQIINQSEKDIEEGVIENANRFMDNADEVHKFQKEFDIIKHKILGLKEKLIITQTNFDEE